LKVHRLTVEFYLIDLMLIRYCSPVFKSQKDGRISEKQPV